MLDPRLIFRTNAETMNFELRHLRYFVAVAEELHFGRAAQRLHISQPPLSMQIRSLEDALGVQLFHRTQRRVALTQAGEAFLREARQILERAAGSVIAAQRASRGEVGQLALGFVSHANYHVLPPLLREFRARAPDVRLQLREATSDRLLEDLPEGRVDAAFVLPPLENPQLDHLVAWREPLVAALPARHPLAKRRGPLALAQLAEAPFILFPRRLAPQLHDDIVACCRAAGFSPRVEQEAVQMQTIVSLVSAEIGVALIPASIENLGRTGVVYRRLAQASPQTEVLLAWRRGDALATLALFVDVARAFVRDAKQPSTRPPMRDASRQRARDTPRRASHTAT
jgi:DNA-binding transcriptional LysR family regulator